MAVNKDQPEVKKDMELRAVRLRDPGNLSIVRTFRVAARPVCCIVSSALVAPSAIRCVARAHTPWTVGSWRKSRKPAGRKKTRRRNAREVDKIYLSRMIRYDTQAIYGGRWPRIKLI